LQFVADVGSWYHATADSILNTINFVSGDYETLRRGIGAKMRHEVQLECLTHVPLDPAWGTRYYTSMLQFVFRAESAVTVPGRLRCPGKDDEIHSRDGGVLLVYGFGYMYPSLSLGYEIAMWRLHEPLQRKIGRGRDWPFQTCIIRVSFVDGCRCRWNSRFGCYMGASRVLRWSFYFHWKFSSNLPP